MPTEQNTAGVGGAPLGVSDTTNSTSPQQPTSPVADQISDLGDILLDKSIDDVQSNDFLPVGQNDIDQLDSVNSEVITNNTSVSTDNLSREADKQNIDSNTIDLGDIDLSGSSENNITDNTDTSTEPVLDIDTTIPNESITDEVELPEIEATPSEPEITVDTAESDIITDTIQNENIEENNIDEITVDTNELSDNSTNAETNSEQNINQTEDINITNDLTIDQSINEPLAESIDSLDTTNLAGTIETANIEQTPIVEEITNEVSSEESTINDSSIDLGGTSLENTIINEETGTSAETQTNDNSIQTEQSNDNTDSIDFDALENIDLPESTSVNINNGDSNEETGIDSNIESLTTTQSNESAEVSLDNIILPNTAQDNQEEQFISEDSNTISDTTENRYSGVVITDPSTEPVLEEIIESPIIESNESIETSSVENVSTPIVTEAAIELPVDTGINIDDKLASIAQVAEKVEEGIDLDSLVGPDEQKNNSEDLINNNTIIAPQQDVVAPVVQNDTTTVQTTTQDKKPLKMALVGMGIVAVLGAGYFGYKTVFPMGLGNTESTSIMSGDMGPDLYSGDIMSGDALSGNVGQNSGEVLLDDILSGSTNSGDTDMVVQPDDNTNPDGNTGEPTTTRTLDDIKNDADLLVSKARKLLIKATIAKNGPARISAFSIQKDVDSFVQTLANTTDITTLEASEKTLEQLSQRLTSLENRLNGSSN